MRITTTEMHTGGEPVRIIESGYPVPQGETILDKINDLRQNHDHYRKFVIFEPHGHFDMYGVLLVTPDHPEADIATIFLNNEGYSTMCGHACISVARYAVDKGLIHRPITFPETQVNIQAPCGLVKTFVSVEGGDNLKSGRVRFESVPSFVVATDLEVQVEGHDVVKVDVAYGGAFYAFVSITDLGLDFQKSSIGEINKAATAVTNATKKAVTLTHPDTPAFLYGTIVVDTRDRTPCDVSTNICIFADSETDRSPCGSGTTARIALMYHRGHIILGQHHTFQNGVTGSQFLGRPVKESQVENKMAVVVEIKGEGYYTGRSELTLEENDSLGRGFLIR
uniref:trans-L-3-hydroxyproline dehydratase n=3 Tax=Arion vulgaris TaxID=1028688 RepID=A0A0B7B4B8_9EUPU